MARNPRRFMMPDIDSPDWKNPGKQHSFDEFYIPAKDEEGTSHRIYCNIPGELYGWLDTVVASQKFPFQRTGDLVRYAIYLALCQLSNIEQGVPDMRVIIQRTARVLWQKEAEANVVGHLDELAAAVAKLQKLHAWSELLDLLASERRGAEQMCQCPGSSYWGRYWVEELSARFSHLEQIAKSKLPAVHYIDLRPSQAYHDESEEV